MHCIVRDAMDSDYVDCKTKVCLADDEGDPGMGYELGIAFFYSYSMFSKKAQRLLINAYTLTDRDGFKPILMAHLKTRDSRKDPFSHLAGNSILRFTLKQKPKAKGRGAQKAKTAKSQRTKAQKQKLDELSSDDAE